MRPGIGGVQQEAAADTVIPGDDQRLVIRVGADVLKRDVVELGEQTRIGVNGRGEDGAAIRQETGRIDKIGVTQVSLLAPRSMNKANRERVVASQLARNL